MPAAIVSPPLRNSIRPISLFTMNVSSGMGTALSPGPEIVDDRNEICTLADVPFASTRGFCLITVPVARSSVANNLLMVTGTSREWWKSSTDTPAVMGYWMSNMII